MKKITEQYTGGVVDESLSGISQRIIETLPGETSDIKGKVALLLGRYRGFRKSSNTSPQAAVTINHLHDIAEQAKALRMAIDLIPLDAEAIAAYQIPTSWGASYHAFERGLVQDLIRLQALMVHVAGELEPWRNKPGGKPNRLEHELLSDVAEIIETHADGSLGKIEIAGLAAEILTSSGVFGVPATPEKARNAIRAWRRGPR